jgi:hypothetical protein
MNDSNLSDVFDRKLTEAEAAFEAETDEMLGRSDLPVDTCRSYLKQVEADLAELHEIRRALLALS